MVKDPARKAEHAKLTAGMAKNTRAEVDPLRWYAMRIVIQGETLSAELDGQLVATLTSGGIAHAAKQEFYFAVAGASARFDDLLITANPVR